jgi:hypothetical protein
MEKINIFSIIYQRSKQLTLKINQTPRMDFQKLKKSFIIKKIFQKLNKISKVNAQIRKLRCHLKKILNNLNLL